MEFIQTILDVIKAHTLKRKIDLPGGRDAHIMLDASGNETLVIKDEYDRTHHLNVAAVDDIVYFAKDLPNRYGQDRAKDYREIYISVDHEDIPTRFTLSDKLDNRMKASIGFDLKEHRDFVRWMSAKNMSQLDFRTLLLEQATQHDQPDLAGMLSIIKYKTEIEYEASIETERNFRLAFSESEAKGSIDIPKIIVVTCPVISGTKHEERIEFEVVIKKPKPDSGEKIKFSLLPYGKDRRIIFRDAALEVCVSEFVGPVQEALAQFTTTLPPVFLRTEPKENVYQDSSLFTFMRK